MGGILSQAIFGSLQPTFSTVKLVRAPDYNMPTATTPVIPIIDISAAGAGELDVAKALVDAAAEHGFVYIKNTGKDITAQQISNAFELVSS